MSFINSFILFIRNIFARKQPLLILDKPEHFEGNTKKADFVESLKISTDENIKNKKVETLICEGDGLGIQRKMSF